MKQNYKRRFCAEDGYILLYVMVVIMTLCILAASVCTSAVRNLKVQQHSIEHMEFVYEAEGVVERFTAELVQAVKSQERMVESSGVDSDAKFESQMEEIFRAGVDIAEANALMDRELDGDVMNDPLESLEIQFDEDTHLGTYVMDLRVVSGDSAVETQMQCKMVIVQETLKDESDTIVGYLYKINQMEYEYLSYIVETVEIVDIHGYTHEEGDTE